MADRRALGASGEDLAAAWYAERGWRVLDRNWRSGRDGELDVVATKGGVLVVCEVKARSSVAFGTPLEAVTPAKQARIRRLAAAYLAASPVRARTVRFDVAAVLDGRLEVVEDAF
ncbi:MAG TPA: YraN family protein [Acidimicrobiales bacterium]|nr:YraN family protein [Acidimicrobiales bacterium]